MRGRVRRGIRRGLPIEIVATIGASSYLGGAVGRKETSESKTADEPVAVLLDPAKTTSGRSRFFCDLAGILQGLGYRVGFAYPGNVVKVREYPYPPESLERTLERRSTAPEGSEEWLRWTPSKSHVITRRSLAVAIHDAALVVVPATVDLEVGRAIRSTPGFAGLLLLSDHTGSRLNTGTTEGRAMESYRGWLELVDGVHVVSDGLAKIARRHGGRHVFTIPPTIDERAFISRWRLLLERVVPRHRVILVPGALLKAKGCVTMLRAFANVRARHPGWQLDFFGEGPERPILETLIRELDLVDVAKLHGFDSGLATRYRDYPIVASATAFESLPLVLIEAMAAGCVTVFPATAGGPATIIRDRRNGFLARTDKEADVAEALEEAIECFESGSRSWRSIQVQAMKSALVAKRPRVTEAWRAQLEAYECGTA